ncbi:MAG: isochorismate synthase [Crocinitomicaceae bacterium]|nr:isochorismate synthase [Crocinitomicaceae bacterium]
MDEYNSFFTSFRPFFIGFLPVTPEEKRKHFSFFTDRENKPLKFVARHFFDNNHNKGNVAVSRDEYLQIIERAVEKIKSGIVSKIVISRIKNTKREKDISLSLLLLRMKENYPNAFVYAFRNKEGELWMGATPELLLSRNNGKFTTVSLAATQPVVEGKNTSKYHWTKKEIEEQKIVSDFIISELHSNGALRISAGTAQTVIAGKVAHLKTIIEFESEKPSGYWLDILHPTPAVCGFPREASRTFILENEKYGRSYYCGYIGVEDEGGMAEYFVNLRCMRVNEDSFDMFVGGGIMERSDPSAEWDETEWKSETLLALINRPVSER